MLFDLVFIELADLCLEEGVLNCLNGKTSTALASGGASQTHGIVAITGVIKDCTESFGYVSSREHLATEEMVFVICTLFERVCPPDKRYGCS